MPRRIFWQRWLAFFNKAQLFRRSAALVAWLALALPVFAAQPVAGPDAAAHTWSGVVSHVVDGDTLHVRAAPHAEPRRIRILGIDAPERCQAHGQAAREALQALALGRTVTVVTARQDDYGRDLAVVYLGRKLGRGASPDPSHGLDDLGLQLVRAGHAWSYRFRQDPGPYAQQEQQARLERRGLFGKDSLEYPGSFRRRHGPCPWGPASSR